jgi:hypothetical protein
MCFDRPHVHVMIHIYRHRMRLYTLLAVLEPVEQVLLELVRMPSPCLPSILLPTSMSIQWVQV